MSKDKVTYSSLITTSLTGSSPIGIESGGSEITMEYRNGAVINWVVGETATLNFEAKVNANTAVTFTVNWGADIGTTIIETTLVNGVWKALESQMFIPVGVTLGTVIITDSIGFGYSDLDYYGAELVTNGNFDTDSDWTLSTNWSISGGKLRAIQDVVGDARQENVGTIGKMYLVEIKVDVNTPSGLSVSLGSTSNRIPIITLAGTYSGILIADGARLAINPQYDFQLNTEIDYISIRESL